MLSILFILTHCFYSLSMALGTQFFGSLTGGYQSRHTFFLYCPQRLQTMVSTLPIKSYTPTTVKTLQRSPRFRSLFDWLGLRAEARKMAVGVLVSFAEESSVRYFTTESQASFTYLETINAISSTDDDMEVQYLDYKRHSILPQQSTKCKPTQPWWIRDHHSTLYPWAPCKLWTFQKKKKLQWKS